MKDPNELEVIKNYYFKDSLNLWTLRKTGATGMHFISGLPLPIETDGKVHDKKFVDCEFHPLCETITFVNCSFICCDGWEKLPQE